MRLAVWTLLHSSLTLAQKIKYTDIVVFGASYCDDGHARSAPLQSTLTPVPYDGGRYSNGPTFSEYMNQSMNSNLHNYASVLLPPQTYSERIALISIGGAVNDEAVFSEGRYSNSDEVNSFLQDISSKAVLLGNQTVVVTWSGINSLKDTFDAYALNKTTATWAAALNRSARNGQAILSQFTQISNAISSLTNATYLILSIPPLQTAPQIYYGAENNRGHSVQDLSEINLLTQYYNQALRNGTLTGGNSSSSFLYYDAYSWWENLANATNTFVNTTWPCLTSASNTLCAPCTDGQSDKQCSNPDTYMYWDALHPNTVVHRDLAEQLASQLNASTLTTTAKSSPASKLVDWRVYKTLAFFITCQFIRLYF